MNSQNKSQFKVSCEGKVLIGDGHKAENDVTISIKNGPQEALTKMSLRVKCGPEADALLDAKGAEIEVTFTGLSQPLAPQVSDKDHLEWWNSSSGTSLAASGEASFSLSNFEANTPPGDAVLHVVVEVFDQDEFKWSTVWDGDVEIEKLAVKTDKPTIHYFSVTPDFLLHAGAGVQVSFYATDLDRVVLYRNNQEVEVFLPESTDGSISGKFVDQPSITTVYRLESKKAEAADTPPPVSRSVQVISSGWNRIALPQGYPARLFVNQDFGGSGAERLYGIFVSPDKNGRDGRTAALYSSATGVDDWREEAEAVKGFPQEMAESPGLAFDNCLWLIGGSCVDPDKFSRKVWRYEKEREGEPAMVWRRGPDFPERMKQRAGHACVVHRGELWVLGGFCNGESLRDIWKLEGRTWVLVAANSRTNQHRSPSPPQWPARFQHAAVSVGDEVWIYGGTDLKPLEDLWSTREGNPTDWVRRSGIRPQPGLPLAATLARTADVEPADQRLFLAGTFRAEGGNRITSYIFEWQKRNQVWETQNVGDGWEQFGGSPFYMQAVAFNRFFFVWSLHTAIDPKRPPKLNILIPS